MTTETKKCSVCGKECKNLGAHMRKHESGVKDAVKSDISPLDVKMDQVIAGLNTMAAALAKLVEMQPHGVMPVATSPTTSSYIPKLEDETHPESYVPPKFRQIVNDILSPEFGIRVLDFVDRTDFQLDIFVPDRFSSLSADEKKQGIKDVRTRIVPRALGENGVREWCELVKRNLAKYYGKEGIQSPFKNQQEAL